MDALPVSGEGGLVVVMRGTPAEAPPPAPLVPSGGLPPALNLLEIFFSMPL